MTKYDVNFHICMKHIITSSYYIQLNCFSVKNFCTIYIFSDMTFAQKRKEEECYKMIMVRRLFIQIYKILKYEHTIMR